MVYIKNSKKKNIINLVFKEYPTTKLVKWFLENGIPCIDLKTYSANYYQFESIYDKLSDYFCKSDIFIEGQFKSDYAFYKEVINFKRESLEKHIEKINARLKKEYNTKLFEHQEYAIRWAALRNSLIIADDMGLGKGNTLDTKILTPNGWIEMRDIKVGTRVIGSNGKPCNVVGVYPQGVKDVYKVIFNDKSFLKCDEEHLWKIKTPCDKARKLKGKVWSLKKILEKGYTFPNGNSKYFIPLVEPIEFEGDNKFVIEPYILGLILGDGGISQHSIVFTTSDWYIIDYLSKILPSGLHLVKKRGDKYSWGISTITCQNIFIRELKRLNLLGKKSENKFIPDCYKYASVEDRIALLQGLMDTDGECGKPQIIKKGTTLCYTSKSKQLIKDLGEIVNSLGGVYRWGKPKIVNGQEYQRITINLPKQIKPFLCNVFRAERYQPKTKYQPVRAIVDIKYIGQEECQCIKVDAEDSLYVAENYIVTHNTLTAIAAAPVKAPILVICPSNAKYVWKNQFKKWVDRESFLLEGRKSFFFPGKREIVVINYDILPECLYRKIPRNADGTELKKDAKDKFTREMEKERKELLKNCPEGLVVIADEAHRLKSVTSLRSKRFKYISEATRKLNGKIWALTGTPVTNRLEELYAIIRTIGAVEESFGTDDILKKELGGYAVKGNFTWGQPKETVKYYLANNMLRRTKKDVFNLPPLIEDNLEVPIDEETRKDCDQFEAMLVEMGISLEEALNLARNPDDDTIKPHLMRLKAKLAEAKIPGVLSMIEDAEYKGNLVIVACTHTKPLDFFGARKNWCKITGETSAKKRDKIQKEFNDIKYKGMALSTIAGGEALTLTACSYIIVVDKWWSPTAQDQLHSRAHRFGQEAECVNVANIYVDHPLEKRIDEILDIKTNLIQKTVEAVTKVDLKKRENNVI